MSSLQRQVQKFVVDASVKVLYNYCLDRKERLMTYTEFFRLNQEQWFQEFVETELPENLDDTSAQIEKFEFDDVPF